MKTYEVYNIETDKWLVRGTYDECNAFIEGRDDQFMLDIREA